MAWTPARGARALRNQAPSKGLLRGFLLMTEGPSVRAAGCCAAPPPPMSCPRSGCYLAGDTASPPRLLRPSEGGLGVGLEGGCLRRVEAWSRPCRGTFWKREEGLASGGVGGLQAALRPQGEWEKRFFPEGLKGKSHIHIPKGTALMSFLFRPGG